MTASSIGIGTYSWTWNGSEVLAFDEFHREEVDVLPVVERPALEAVDVGDVRMIEGGEQLGLALKTGEPFAVLRQLGGEHLDGHVAVELRVPCTVHLAHPTGADGRGDLVRPEADARRKAHGSQPSLGNVRGILSNPCSRALRQSRLTSRCVCHILWCMRTTVNLPDPLLAQARRRAAETGRTLTSFIADAVRESLARRREGKNEPPVRLTTFRGSGLQPGVDLDDSAVLEDLMNGTDAASGR